MKILSLAAIAATIISSSAWAQAPVDVSVTNAWARATVPQQKATGAFMQIKSNADARIVEVKSKVAGTAEIHEMKMDGDVMRMRAVPSLALPAGRAVDLAPGGYHVMLTELKEQLKAGDSIALTMTVETADGKRRDVELQVPVRALGAAASAPQGAHKH